MARAIAGNRQSSQHDVRESTMSDCLSFINDIAKQRGQAFGSPMMQDDEIFETLQNFGAIRGSERVLDTAAGTMTLKDATTITRQQVCTQISAYESNSPFFFFTENWDHIIVEELFPAGVLQCFKATGVGGQGGRDQQEFQGR